MKGADGLAKCDHHWMPRFAMIAAEQLVAPPAQKREGPLAPAGLIREIVGPAAIGIDVMKMRHQSTRQQERSDGEILIMCASKPVAIRLRRAQAQRRSLLGAITGQGPIKAHGHGLKYNA